MQNLIKKISRFNDVRGWNPLPSDIAKSIVIEAAELLEKFQWDESDNKLDRFFRKLGTEDIPFAKKESQTKA